MDTEEVRHVFENAFGSKACHNIMAGPEAGWVLAVMRAPNNVWDKISQTVTVEEVMEMAPYYAEPWIMAVACKAMDVFKEGVFSEKGDV